MKRAARQVVRDRERESHGVHLASCTCGWLRIEATAARAQAAAEVHRLVHAAGARRLNAPSAARREVA